MRSKTIAAAAVLATALAGTTAALAPAGAATATGHATHARAGSYVVDARVNKTEPLLNSKVKIRATVSPAAPGAAVTLQVKYEGRKGWKTIEHGRLSGASKVTFNDKVGSVRQRVYRVVKPAGAGHGAGRGTTLKVTVFGWRALTSIKPAMSSGLYANKSVTMNGTAYPDSITSIGYAPQPYHIDFNLNRDCKRFQGTFGLDDNSASGGSATLSLVQDGVTKFVGGFALTQSQRVGSDLTNVFRITINASIASGGLGAVGTPQVLCSF